MHRMVKIFYRSAKQRRHERQAILLEKYGVRVDKEPLEIKFMIAPVSLADMRDQLSQSSALINNSATIELFGGGVPTDRPAPADATIKLIVRLDCGKTKFVTISGEGNPDLVARATRNIRDVRSKLSNRYAEPIVEPLETGVVNGLSFAVWPFLAEFPQGKLSRYIAKHRVRPNVLDWLYGICAETHTPTNVDERQQIATNLALLHDDRHHPDHVRKAAAGAAERLASGQWLPVQCVQHSDLWLGNIMIAPPGSVMSFKVIDWAGATCTGYPFFDLFRFAISSNAPSQLIQKNLQLQLDQFGFNRVDIASYVLCALGQMQSNLEHFPEKIFRDMVVRTTNSTLKSTGGAA